jgi:hypothetical protein
LPHLQQEQQAKNPEIKMKKWSKDDRTNLAINQKERKNIFELLATMRKSKFTKKGIIIFDYFEIELSE